MELADIFNLDTVKEIEQLLKQQVEKNGSITRSNLCSILGLTIKTPETASIEDKKEIKSKNFVIDQVIGSLITLDIIQGFKNSPGAGGGITSINGKPSKNKSDELDSVFLSKLEDALNHLIYSNDFVTRIPRCKVAEQMNLPGSKTENLISLALKTKAIVGFEAFRGVKGGIGRVVVKKTQQLTSSDKLDEVVNF